MVILVAGLRTGADGAPVGVGVGAGVGVGVGVGGGLEAANVVALAMLL